MWTELVSIILYWNFHYGENSNNNRIFNSYRNREVGFYGSCKSAYTEVEQAISCNGMKRECWPKELCFRSLNFHILASELFRMCRLFVLTYVSNSQDQASGWLQNSARWTEREENIKGTCETALFVLLWMVPLFTQNSPMSRVDPHSRQSLNHRIIIAADNLITVAWSGLKPTIRPLRIVFPNN